MLWPLWSRRACFGTFSAFALCSSGSLPLLVVYGPNKRLFSLLFLSLLIGPFNVYPFLFGHDLVTFWVILDTRLVNFCAEEMNEIAYEYIITTVLQLMLIILLEATRFRVFCTRSYVFGRFRTPKGAFCSYGVDLFGRFFLLDFFNANLSGSHFARSSWAHLLIVFNMVWRH